MELAKTNDKQVCMLSFVQLASALTVIIISYLDLLAVLEVGVNSFL